MAHLHQPAIGTVGPPDARKKLHHGQRQRQPQRVVSNLCNHWDLKVSMVSGWTFFMASAASGGM